jgi:hypothetical protein
MGLAAALGQGFSIQTFFIPVLRKNLNQNSYKNLLKAAYLAGTFIYLYIGYGGAYSNA